MLKEAPLVPYAYTGEPFERSEKMYRILKALVRFPYQVRVEINGTENLDTARELLEQGKFIADAYEHLGVADPITGIHGLYRSGHGDLAEACVYVMKITYVSGRVKDLVPRVLRVVPVVPPSLPDYPKAEAINAQAKRVVQSMTSGVVAVSPIPGRKIPQKLDEAHWGAADFWHPRGEAFVIPTAISGTNKQFPRGVLKIPYGLPYYLSAGRYLHKARITFGEPIPVEKIDEVANRWSHGDERDEKRLRVELVMGVIADLHTEKGYTDRYREKKEKDPAFAKALEDIYKPRIL